MIWFAEPCIWQVTADEHVDNALTPGGERAMGHVVGIIRRKWRTRGYCGSLKEDGPAKAGRHRTHRLFCPVERRFPLIRLVTRQVAPCPFSPFSDLHLEALSSGLTARLQETLIALATDCMCTTTWAFAAVLRLPITPFPGAKGS